MRRLVLDEAEQSLGECEDAQDAPLGELGRVHARRDRPRDAVDLCARQARGRELLAGAGERPLHEPQVRRDSHGPRDLRGVLAREPEEHLRLRDELAEARLLRGRPSKGRIARVIGRPARRRQQLGLEDDLEPLVDRAQPLDELGLER